MHQLIHFVKFKYSCILVPCKVLSPTFKTAATKCVKQFTRAASSSKTPRADMNSGMLMRSFQSIFNVILPSGCKL